MIEEGLAVEQPRPARTTPSPWEQERSGSGSDAQSGARGDHRRAPVVDCVDDLRGVDAVEIDRRHAEVDVAELALDHLQRDTIAGHLDGVGVAQLVGSEASPHPCLR